MKALLALVVAGGCVADVGGPTTTVDAPGVPDQPPIDVDACTAIPHEPGRTEITVRVDPAGHVEVVTTWVTPSLEVSRCLAEAIQRTRFAPTRDGGTLRYAFAI